MTGNEARVEEQSHKSEMRAALRGDFERLRARRQSGGEVVSEQSGPTQETPAHPVPAPTTVPLPDPAQLSWLDRLRGLR